MVCPRNACSLLAAWMLLLQPISLAFSVAKAQEFEESILFARRVVDTTMDGAHFAIPADFDGDGDRDLLATSEGSATVAWYENLGGLEFTRHDIDTSLGSAYPASVKDLDRDGDLDVLAAGYRADICVWYENDGGGTFVRHDIATINGPHSIVAGDLDKDRDLDLVVTSQDDSTLYIFINNGRQRFHRRIIDRDLRLAKYATPVDLNRDGHKDIVGIGFQSGGPVWYENDGRGRFTRNSIGWAPGGYFVDINDIDRDGDLDIISASVVNQSVTWFRNDGAQNFEHIAVDMEARGVRAVAVSNLDRKNGRDILSATVDDDAIAWYQNDGEENFTKWIVDDAVLGAYGVNAADMDGDGLVDVLSAGRDDGTITIHQQLP